MSVPRTLNKFDSSESVTVDLGQSWKLWDNNKNIGTIIMYNGALSIPKGSRDRTVKRVNWIETDRGAFLVETEADLSKASEICRMSCEKLRQIFNSELVKRLNNAKSLAEI
jgi:hypothetical protein